jgi:hypothetical protein
MTTVFPYSDLDSAAGCFSAEIDLPALTKR